MIEDNRFWQKVRKTDSCWLWEGTKNDSGYGIVWRDNLRHRAHRWAWFLTYGQHLQFNGCHTCDVPACVNPAHIVDATQAWNITDCIEKGRANGLANLNKQEWALSLAQVKMAQRMIQYGHTKQSVALYFAISRPALDRNLARDVAQ